jgi:hypothetical protein
MKYAIIDNQTNLVLNIVISDNESNIFLQENEFLVQATRSTKIGILYDKTSGTFPEIVEIDEMIDYQDEIDSLISEISFPLPNHLSEENREIFISYYNQLSKLKGLTPSEGRTELENISKPNFELLVPPPETEE